MGSRAQSVFHPVFRWLWSLHNSFGTRRRKELSLDRLLYIIPQAWNHTVGAQAVLIKILGNREQLVSGLGAFERDQFSYVQSPKTYQIFTKVDHGLEPPKGVNRK